MSLKEKIIHNDIAVTVIGLGYVGLPLSVLAAQKGLRTYGYDISKERVAQLQQGKSYVDDVHNTDIQTVIDTGTFIPTTDPGVIQTSDVIIICVPTPLNKYKIPDVTYITAAAETVGTYLRKESLVILESTTYPGTTEELVVPILEKKSGLICGKDFFVAFAPERVDPGNKEFQFSSVPKVVGGISPEHTDVAVAFYRLLLDNVHPVSSTQVAEMTKLLENIYRLVNISMINEMALLCGKMNIDIWEVIEAAKTKPYGFQAFYPGPGAGGHCIPLDPFYLSWKAKEYDFNARFIELAGDVNYRMPEYALSKIMFALNQHQKALNGSKILLLGVAYKKDIADPRESPIIRLIELLQKKKAVVDFYDPHVASVHLEDRMHTVMHGKTTLKKEDYAGYDCVVIGTDHSSTNYDEVVAHAPLIVDLRNAIKDHTLAHVYRF